MDTSHQQWKQGDRAFHESDNLELGFGQITHATEEPNQYCEFTPDGSTESHTVMYKDLRLADIGDDEDDVDGFISRLFDDLIFPAKPFDLRF